MAFKYRLQKILDLREQELEEVKVRFQEANRRIAQLKADIEKNILEQGSIRKALASGAYLGAPSVYLNKLKSLEIRRENLEQDLLAAEELREQIREELVLAQQKVEALNKHKDKQQKAFNYAELKQEEKELNELGLMMRRLQNERE